VAEDLYPLSRYSRPILTDVDYERLYSFKSVFPQPVPDPPLQGQVDLVELDDILSLAAQAPGLMGWQRLLDRREFGAPVPPKPSMPPKPEPPPVKEIRPPKLKELPPPPSEPPPFQTSSFWQRIFPGLSEQTAQQAEGLHRSRSQEWEKQVAEIKAKNDLTLKLYEGKKAKQHSSDEAKAYAKAATHWEEQWRLLDREHAAAVARWRAAKDQFEAAARSEHARLTELHQRYLAGNRNAIEFVTTLVLRWSRYPRPFPRNVEVHYKPENRIAVVNFQLPDFQTIQIIKNGKKSAQREKTEVQEVALYAIALRTLHEVVVSDQIDAIASIAFNGWVHFIDGATGRPRNEYILSIHATKVQISGLNITKVNPTECFRSLKGLAAKRISAYTPIAPILTLNKCDDRLVEGKQVLDGLSANDNLAAVDWETFEHLVRELFEREFSKPGTEVRITRASRDRGVDAIIFDPDPIRGGKFIIQAKKYTNTVDVSAVRDLFGTIQAEGANRGILVTTSQFGPDAYEFAKDKNISLLDGPNLLHLFEKHGYAFRIDLDEARQLMGLDS
jgi:restriction system protein